MVNVCSGVYQRDKPTWYTRRSCEWLNFLAEFSKEGGEWCGAGNMGFIKICSELLDVQYLDPTLRMHFSQMTFSHTTDGKFYFLGKLNQRRLGKFLQRRRDSGRRSSRGGERSVFLFGHTLASPTSTWEEQNGGCFQLIELHRGLGRKINTPLGGVLHDNR